MTTDCIPRQPPLYTRLGRIAYTGAGGRNAMTSLGTACMQQPLDGRQRENFT